MRTGLRDQNRVREQWKKPWTTGVVCGMEATCDLATYFLDCHRRQEVFEPKLSAMTDMQYRLMSPHSGWLTLAETADAESTITRASSNARAAYTTLSDELHALLRSDGVDSRVSLIASAGRRRINCSRMQMSIYMASVRFSWYARKDAHNRTSACLPKSSSRLTLLCYCDANRC